MRVYLWLGLCAFALTANAKELTSVDPCEQTCTLEAGTDGQIEPVCTCKQIEKSKKSFEKASAWPSKTKLLEQLDGVSEKNISIVVQNSCQNLEHHFLHNTKDILIAADLSARPLCECVDVRLHFPVAKQCHTMVNGTDSCSFPIVKGKVSPEPIRIATVYDYQSCIAKNSNYKKPVSCDEAKTCLAPPDNCDVGTELVNIADPESCCPVFVCVKSK